VLVALQQAPDCRPAGADAGQGRQEAGGGSAAERIQARAAAVARAWQHQPVQGVRVRVEVYRLCTDSTSAGITSSHGTSPAAPVAPQLLLQAAAEYELVGLPFAELEPPRWVMQGSAAAAPGNSTSSGSGGNDGSAAVQHSVQLLHSSLGLEPCIAQVDLHPASHAAAAATEQTPARPGVEAQGLGTSPSSTTVDQAGITHVRVWATSDDGTPVPLSLAFDSRQVALQQGSSLPAGAPCVLAVYGAYGREDGLGHTAARAALLAQGVVCAVAHVRGGGLLGPAWHEAGRGAHKTAGVQDTLACARHLIDAGITHPRRLCLTATSAGGWVAGAALNTGHPLFRAAVLTVPSLDVAATMTDDADSFHELGDPVADPAVLSAVRAWSPADNLPAPGVLIERWVAALRDPARRTSPAPPEPSGASQTPALFPATLVRVGLLDTVVDYWDPAKYVARLRWQLAAAHAAVTGQVGSKVPAPELLMLVRPGGHACFEVAEEEAAMCAFILAHIKG